MEICELPDKEFKIIFLKTLKNLQENTDKQCNEIRKNTRTKCEVQQKENIRKIKQRFWN